MRDTDEDICSKFNSLNPDRKRKALRDTSDWFIYTILEPFFNALDSDKAKIKKAEHLLKAAEELNLWKEHLIKIPRMGLEELTQVIEEALIEVETYPTYRFQGFPIGQDRVGVILNFAWLLRENGYKKTSVDRFRGTIEATDELLSIYLNPRNSKLIRDYILISDRAGYTEDRGIKWPEPRRLELQNVSQTLVDYIDGKPTETELAFIAQVTYNEITHAYELLVERESRGSFDGARIKISPGKQLESFRDELALGIGHTQQTGTEKDTSLAQYTDLIESTTMFRPNVLITQNNAILYLPFKGFYYLDKSQIRVGGINKNKVLENTSA
ncbi:hypothetical protein ACFLYT_00965 [Nanoarchaeota archaeon]